MVKNGCGKQVNKSSLKKKDFSDHQCAKIAENLSKLSIILDNNLTGFKNKKFYEIADFSAIFFIIFMSLC